MSRHMIVLHLKHLSQPPRGSLANRTFVASDPEKPAERGNNSLMTQP
jgi:hypothetical protein